MCQAESTLAQDANRRTGSGRAGVGEGVSAKCSSSLGKKEITISSPSLKESLRCSWELVKQSRIKRHTVRDEPGEPKSHHEFPWEHGKASGLREGLQIAQMVPFLALGTRVFLTVPTTSVHFVLLSNS